MTESIPRSNSRAGFYALVAMMWLALPFTAYRYWTVWDRLPSRMATHFAADGRPNGWMTPQQSLRFSLTMLAILLTVFTLILVYAGRRSRQLTATSWSTLGLFYVIVGVTTYISDGVLQHNVSGASIPLAGVIGVLMTAIVVFMVIFLWERRGTALPESAPISEEKHASPAMALVCLIPAAVIAAVAAAVPTLGLKLTLFAAALVVVGCAGMAWDGFHYGFSTAGVEIRALGFRLRSIPVSEIRNYAVDRWQALGGYGIRGIGDTRAYVWSNTGVRIKLNVGEVFLGHKEPGRVIHDLDLITKRPSTASRAGVGHEDTRSL